MTQKDLADLLGKKESEISKWMTGTHNFTIRSIAKIERALNVSIFDIEKKKQSDGEILKANTRDFLTIHHDDQKTKSIILLSNKILI
jgi:transcriptional regulator with XRE-family HTH domain